MANSKMGRHYLEIKMGKIDVDKKILKDVEKIILKRITPKDHFIKVGKPKGLFELNVRDFDWAKEIPSTTDLKWVVVKTKMRNISIKFTPRNTTIIVQRIYARGEELKALNEIAREIETYLKPHAKKSFLGISW